jgi:putative addiction module CopG family antidote
MIVRQTQNVSLTPDLETFIEGRFAYGRYRSASEVVSAGLRLLQEAECRRERRREALQTATPGKATAKPRVSPARGR